MVRTNKKTTEVEFFFGGFDDLSSAKRAFDVKKAKKREAEDADADERARKSANRNKALLCYLLPMLAFSVGALYYTFALLLHPEPQYVLAEPVPWHSFLSVALCERRHVSQEAPPPFVQPVLAMAARHSAPLLHGDA